MGTGNTTADVPPSGDDRARRRRTIPQRAMTLVIAHSKEEPQRTGELALLEGPGPWTIGRPSDEHDILPFIRQAPGESRITGALSSIAVSRNQLRILLTPNGFELTNRGRLNMRINRIKREQATIVAGDVIELGDRYVFYVKKRVAALPPMAHLALRHPFGEADTCNIAGESPEVWALRDLLAYAAQSRVHVLLHGDTGTGKELCARAFHFLSPQSRGAFIARSGGTLTIELVIAELFGNVKNYPNPGMPEHIGLLAEANDGTLFLDEISQLPLQAQAALLRVLDAGEYHRLGETKPRRSNAVIVAAMNGDLSALKNDLLPRFTIRIHVPNIDQRREDIPLIVRQRVLQMAKTRPDYARFVRTGGERTEIQIEGALIAALLRRSFKGNVRELDALISRAAASSRDDCLTLPDDFDEAVISDEANVSITECLSREATIALLERHRWHVQRAAEAADISRWVLGRLIKKYGLKIT